MIKEKARDESCSEELHYNRDERENIDPSNRSITIDTGDGEEKYYITLLSGDRAIYSNYYEKDSNDRLKNFYPKVSILIDGEEKVVVDFVVYSKEKDDRSYVLHEEYEELNRSEKYFSKVEGDTFIERLVSVEDEFCSKFGPELAEKYKECFNILKGMLQPFVVQDLHHETEEAKYRREIKEKIESLEKELAEKKQELEDEKKEHEKTRGKLKGAFERLSERYERLTSAYDMRESELETEKEAHDKTKTELKDERVAHNNTKSELAKEREEHSKTKQFLSALGDAVKSATTAKKPKTGKAFMADIKEKFSNIVRGKGIEDKEDILSK